MSEHAGEIVVCGDRLQRTESTEGASDKFKKMSIFFKY